MRSAIVTGANGFVGKAVINELRLHNVEVIAVVREITDELSELDGIHAVKCPMENYSSLADMIGHYQPDVFYHFAWNGTAGPNRANERIQLSNVQGACDAVRAAKDIGCKKFVFASSIMEYEVNAEVASMKNPGINSIYSTAKLAADYMTRILAANNMDYISALISNIYGPGENSPRLINTSIRKLLNGEHLALSPGEQLYDFIYITDAAKAFFLIGMSGISGSTYYIGNQSPRKLKDFLKELRDIVAPEAVLGLGEIPFNGHSLTYKEFNTSSLFNDTGFVPEVPFKDGVEQTRDWILMEGNL